MGTNNIVRVNIGGQEYILKTSADRKYLLSVADYINNRMKEIEESMPGNQSQLRTAILSAMNITDELFTERKEKDRMLARLETRLLAIRDYLDDKLKK